jgi:hypothetical protein
MSWVQRYSVIARKITGGLSCAGSGYIIQDVLRDPDKREKSTYHRIMLGFSTMDVFFSFFFYVLNSWVMPKESYFWAAGNVITCDVSAFIGTFGGLSAPLYNCSLATHSLLKLNFNWNNRRIKKTEKWFHLVPCVISLAICIAAKVSTVFGPVPNGLCGTTTGYPFGCDLPNSTVSCIRGSGMDSYITFYTIYSVVYIGTIIYVSILMFAVFRFVHRIEVDAEKYSFMARFNQNYKNKTRKRSRRVLIQGILYFLASFLIFIWPLIGFISLVAKQKRSLTVYVLVAIFTPLQGFFNCLIYLMPVFRKWLKTFRKEREERRKKVETTSIPKKNDLDIDRHDRIVGEEKEEEKQEIQVMQISEVPTDRDGDDHNVDDDGESSDDSSYGSHDYFDPE